MIARLSGAGIAVVARRGRKRHRHAAFASCLLAHVLGARVTIIAELALASAALAALAGVAHRADLAVITGQQVGLVLAALRGLAEIARASVLVIAVDAVVDRLIDILADISPVEAVVRIGDGAPTISSRIANVCLARGLAVQFVDEHSTSIGSRHDHIGAARAICSLEGIPVIRRVQVIPSDGEVREIQRRSRRISEGRLTIPQSLARAVAVGRLTLTEAVELHLNSLDG